MAQLQLYSFNINEENIDDVYLKVFKLPSEVKEVINELKEDNSKFTAIISIYYFF